MHELCLKHMKNISDLFDTSITNIYVTLSSNLAYLPPQDYFSWVLNSLLGPKVQNKIVLKYIGMGYVKMHGFHGNPLYDSQELG